MPQIYEKTTLGRKFLEIVLHVTHVATNRSLKSRVIFSIFYFLFFGKRCLTCKEFLHSFGWILTTCWHMRRAVTKGKPLHCFWTERPQLAGQLCAIFQSNDTALIYVFTKSSIVGQFCAIMKNNVAGLGYSTHFQRAVQLGWCSHNFGWKYNKLKLHISVEQCQMACSIKFPEKGCLACFVHFLSAGQLLGCFVHFWRGRTAVLQV